MKKNSNRFNSLVKVGIGFLVLFLLNIGGAFYYFRFDLTSEKRHTLTPETVQLVQNLEDVVFVRVYLEGEFPADFKRLRNAVEERLAELRAYAGDNVQYEFINPSENPDREARENTWKRLVDRGLEPTEITIQGKDALERKLIFPGAILSYQGKEAALQILRSTDPVPSPQLLNSSINNLEYNLVNAIKRLTQPNLKKIAIIKGHGELDPLAIEDFTAAARELYTVDTVRIDSQLNSLLGYDGIVIAKPQSAFSEKDKFIIDQFLMKGGSILWCLDGIQASMDSLKGTNNSQTLGLATDLNLNDQLFSYGVRIENNLLIDRNCGPIALNVGKFGDQPNLQLFPWYFDPLIAGNTGHPVAHNINPVLTQFVSRVDTIGLPGIKKSILLQTSPFTRIMRAPVRINLGIVGINPNFNQNTVGPQPVAVLLEGKFQSAFDNRISPQIASSKEINFKAQAIKPVKMIVVGDGDVIRNRVDRTKNIFYPLGYDQYQKKRLYGNREFLMNCLNYLLDDSGVIAVRSREIKIRKLNAEIEATGKTRWQTINLIAPILIVSALGLAIYLIRRKRFV
ncbi:MAG TPA: gliding motility-associated ABC transporter substrate-binding protein GldG [Luteibaculaceae bacterium]|nr:gliding motility-associated ABC transporter substrate-binding protein GldG [Luteibaculaceae bacterium]